MSKDSNIMERRFVTEGTLIMRQGDPGNSAYLIQSGSVRVFSENKGARVDLGKLELGQIFGEMSLIFDEPRSASVEAAEDTNLIVINSDTFKKKLHKTDPTIRAVITMLTARIASVNKSLINKQSNIRDLRETARLMYQNILSGLPQDSQRDFQSSVLPKLEDLLAALQNFQDKHPG